MMIEVNYVHFHNLNRNVLDLGKQVRELADENARLKAEVERLTKAIDLTIIDLDERHERQDLRAWEFAELLRKAKEGKQPN
jgi:hypothetical protein